MNSSFVTEPKQSASNSSMTNIEPWFIPVDIILVASTSLAILLAIFFLILILLDKACRTIPMMLVTNSCLSALIFGCGMLGLCTFTLQNDLKQIEFYNSLCIYQTYISYCACAVFNLSFVLQALYRYVTVVYPARLFWQSARFQCLLICLTWIYGFALGIIFIIRGDIIYNVTNQICQIPLRLSFSIIYMVSYVYLIPVSMTMFVYFKLVRYVKQMGKRVTSANMFLRAQRELKMVQRTVVLISMLVTLGLPYTIFMIISFFTAPPKYHFRIAFIFIDGALASVMIVLFRFTDPLKASLMKKMNMRPNTLAATMT